MDFGGSRIHQSTNFVQNLMRRTAFNTPPDPGDHAKRAVHVAASHDRHVSLPMGWTPSEVANRRVHRNLGFTESQNAFLPAEHASDHVGNSREMSTATNDVDMGFSLKEFAPLTIGHAPDDAHHEARVSPLPLSQFAEEGMHFFLGPLAYRASMKKTRLRLFGIVRFSPPPVQEGCPNQFAVVDIHLTAENPQVKPAGLRRLKGRGVSHS
jgi:hypothetical protein